MIKLVVSDIDGTLLPIGGKMSPRTIRAIRRCAEEGVYFALASGRTFVNTALIAKEAGVDCAIISANGGRADAHTYESPIYEDRMEDGLSLKVYKRLKAAGCFMTAYVGTKVYTLPETNGYGSTCFSVSEAKPGRSFVIKDDEERMRTEGTKGPYKYEAYTDDRSLQEQLRSEFTQMGLSVSSSFPYNLEILPPGGGKGKSVKELSGILGVKKSEILALGDGSNDIGLLDAAGLPVAMGNAVDSLKAHASVIADDVSRDGAAKIIEKYVFGEDE